MHNNILNKRKLILFLILSIFCLKIDIIYAQQIQYKYDRANRLVQVTYPNQVSVIYSYDKDGNRVQSNITASSTCPNGQASFYAGVNAITNTYQWQVNQGNGFVNISNNANYSGTTSHTLLISNAPTSLYGYQYRCVINGISGNTYSNANTLRFVATWIGNISTAWENPSNWSCSGVPDANTDVIVIKGNPNLPLVNSIASCRSLSLSTSATCTINAGQKLILTGVQ